MSHNSTDENKISEQLFGALNTQSSDISHGLSDEELADLSKPLDTKDGEVIHIRCLKMRMVLPISEEGREALLAKAGAERPSDWAGFYFEVKMCPFCSETQDFEDPVLKRIQSA